MGFSERWDYQTTAFSECQAWFRFVRRGEDFGGGTGLTLNVKSSEEKVLMRSGS